jgi:hypothetical protein
MLGGMLRIVVVGRVVLAAVTFMLPRATSPPA